MALLQWSLAIVALAQAVWAAHGGAVDGKLQKLRAAPRQLPRILSFNDVDTTETVYADDAQAWRMLGLYMDCEAQDDGTSVCQRYLLWAAYVDEDYTGNGHGEYMFYNAEKGKWDKSACKRSGSERCVKMDCHLRNTHFKVLGYYKQYGVSEFFEQLFGHQGSCSWTDTSYSFMENNRELWPEECTQSAVTDASGSSVYYDVKPLSGGKMTIGLYKDAVCSHTYTGSLTVQEVLQASIAQDEQNNDNANNEGNGANNVNEPAFGSEEWFEEWNAALGTYRTCQPCKVSSLGNEASGRRLEDQGDENDEAANQQNDDGGMFGCQDAYGYQGVNQCALFATNTDVAVATFRDVRLATLQGTIMRAHGAGVTSTGVSKWWRDWGFFTMSALVFLIGLCMFCCFAKVKRRTSNPDAKEPLLTNNKSSKSRSRK